MYRTFRRCGVNFLVLSTLFCVCLIAAQAQSTNDAPLTTQELVRLVYQLPSHPDKKDEVIEEIRRRGIGFPLTAGLRSLVATKSGNDALLRRTLEEAERRRLNPVASALPSEAEGRDILDRSGIVTLAATDAMPDFIVKQQISRSYARAETNNWIFKDRLTIAVSYRARAGEEYKLLAVNGLPADVNLHAGQSYADKLGGASSAGEYVTMLSEIFDKDSQTEFKMVDTDLLRGRRTIVYEYQVKRPFSKLRLKSNEMEVGAAYHGRVWIDRENYRVLRFEQIAEPPADFSITAASSLIDYDWVTIAERQYLLPSLAEIILTTGKGQQAMQDRNDIRFRNYQKFGAEVKILDEVDDKELPEDKPENKPKPEDKP